MSRDDLHAGKPDDRPDLSTWGEGGGVNELLMMYCAYMYYHYSNVSMFNSIKIKI